MFSSGPKIYAVYVNPSHPTPYETAEFIPESAAIWGFFFHFFWCFYHKLWLHGGIIMALWAVFLAGGQQFGLNPFTIGVLELLLRGIVCFEGNSWRQSSYKKRGYILSDIVTGDGEIAAKQRFYERWLQTQPQTIPNRISGTV
jgi:hypothetical protein